MILQLHMRTSDQSHEHCSTEGLRRELIGPQVQLFKHFALAKGACSPAEDRPDLHVTHRPAVASAQGTLFVLARDIPATEQLLGAIASGDDQLTEALVAEITAKGGGVQQPATSDAVEGRWRLVWSAQVLLCTGARPDGVPAIARSRLRRPSDLTIGLWPQ